MTVAVAAVHFVVSCSLIVLHLCTTWDPEPAVETGWTSGAPLWRLIHFPLGELPLRWLVDRGLITPLLFVLPLNSCVVGASVAAFTAVARRAGLEPELSGGVWIGRGPGAHAAPGDFDRLRLPPGARKDRRTR